MRVLIIGGAGYIGGVTAQLAAEQGFDVTVFDDLSSGLKKNLPRGARFVEGDVRSRGDLRRAFKDARPDVVIHFAAKILVPESVEKPYDYLATNSLGVLNSVEAATEFGVMHYILSSTAAVYGAPKQFPITEDQPTVPINPYGESKLIAEHVLRSYQQSRGLNWLAFRYFNVAGAYGGVGPDYPFVSHLIPALLDSSRQGKPFTLYGTDYDTVDGTCVRDYVHVEDIGRAHLLAAEKMVAGERICQPINLGSATGFSVRQVANEFLIVTGKTLEIVEGPRRPGDPDKLVASNRRAKELLNWAPKKDLTAIITGHAKWYDSLPAVARVKNI
jgi:UDP-glucose 4-epimerase